MSLESVLSVFPSPRPERSLRRPPLNTLLSQIEPDIWTDFREIFEEATLASGETPDVDGRIWFPTSAVLGLNVRGADGATIDVALAGRHAALGTFPLPALDSGQTSTRWVVRLGGTALRARADQLARLKTQSKALTAALEDHEAAWVSGLLHAALCARAHLQEGRLASLLLRLMEGAGRSQLEISQETLAEMLGVQRTTLSAAASDLKRLRLIRYARGRILILDPEGLSHRACERCDVSDFLDQGDERPAPGRTARSGPCA